MKVSDLKRILSNCNDDMNVLVCLSMDCGQPVVTLLNEHAIFKDENNNCIVMNYQH